MKVQRAIFFLSLCFAAAVTWAQPPIDYDQPGVVPQATDNQLKWLESHDPQLAKNKKLVFDFWRIVYEGGHADEAPKYMRPEYIQHNPNVASGRDAFIKFFKEVRKPVEVQPFIKQQLISIVAEGDIVILTFVRPVAHPTKPGKTFAMTWFDKFRVEDGRIAEHWDPAEVWLNGAPPGVEYFPK